MKKQTTNLTREQIDQYRSASGKDKNSLERNIDSFEQDALDGWTESGLPTEDGMRRLDKKFSSNIPRLYFFGAGVVILVLGTFFFYRAKSNEKDRLSNKPEHSFSIDKSRLSLPTAIDTLQEIPKSNQLRIATIKRQQKQIETVVQQSPAQTESQIDVPDLPPHVPDEPVAKVNVRKNGKEIYLQDLKLLDYTSYREKAVIEIERIIITGTSADLESENDRGQIEQETVDVPYMHYLEETMKLVRKEKWKASLQRFGIILEKYPDDINARFYGGICAFNLGNFSLALTHFQNCQKSVFDNFYQESMWYEALSFIRLGRKGEARNLLQRIIAEGGFYTSQAKAELKKM